MAEETRKEREARWWRDWFAEDYSWDGLARKPIRGGGQFGETTLQEYWRCDQVTGIFRDDAALKIAGELVEFDGRWWHLAHLPARSLCGKATWKADLRAEQWRALGDLLAARLGTIKESVGAFGLNSLTDLMSVRGGQSATFWLPEGRDGRARFDGCIMGPMQHSHSGLASISYRNAAFLCEMQFSGAEFAAGTDFANILACKPAYFRYAVFLGEAFFECASFSEFASFEATRFSKYASFLRAKFFGRGDFRRAELLGDAHFHGVAMLGAPLFERAVFSRDARFDGVDFSHEVTFERTLFKARTVFSGTFLAKASFRHAIFEGPLEFSATIEAPERDFSGAFYGARFADIADFSGAVGEMQGGRMAAAFAQAQFEKALVLTDGFDGRSGKVLQGELLAVTRAVADEAGDFDRVFAALESGCRVVRNAMGRARDEVREQSYYRLVLKAQQCRDIGRWERVVGWLYGWVSDYGSSFSRPLVLLLAITVAFGLLYWGLGVFGSATTAWCPGLLALAFAGIGWSASRKGANEGALTGFLVGQGAMVLLIAGLLGGDPVWQGQKMALSAVFRPFATLAEQASRNAPAWPEAARLALHLITTIQSLLSGVLIFLFGLAIKRRFQIS